MFTHSTRSVSLGHCFLKGIKMISWIQKGVHRVLAGSHNKFLIEQDFIDPTTGDVASRALFYGEKPSVIVFGLTSEKEVVAIRQFRFGSVKIQLELPGGNIENGESVLDAAARELGEETGFESKEIIPLWPEPKKMWLDPSSFRAFNYPVMAINCSKTRVPKLDQGEKIESLLTPLNKWEELIGSGEIDSSIMIATTHLALNYLRKK